MNNTLEPVAGKVINWMSVVGLGIAIGTFSVVGQPWVAWSLVSLVLVFFAFVSFTQRDNVLTTPGWLTPFVLFIYYHVRIVFLFGYPYDSIRQPNAEFAYTGDILNYVAFVGSVAIVLFIIGYMVGSAFKVKRVELNEDNPRVFTSLIIFYLGGLISFVLKTSLGFTHYGGFSVVERSSPVNLVLTFAATFQWPIYYYIVYSINKDSLRGVRRVIGLAVIGVHAVQAVTAGGAGPLVLWSFPWILAWDYSSKLGRIKAKIPLKQLPLLAAGGLAVLLTASYMKEVTRGLLTTYGISPSINSVIKNMKLLPSLMGSVSLSETLTTTASRFMGADSMAVIVAQLRSGDQQYLAGYGLWLVPVALVPRLLWPGKPDIALGMWFTDTYWRTPSQVMAVGSGTQGTAFLLPGDFYMNFGVVGVAAGMFAVGIITSYVYRKIASAGSLGVMNMVLLTMLFDSLIRWEFSFASWIASIVQNIIQFSLLYIALKRLGQVQ